MDNMGDINGKTIVDGTFGGGGYTRAFLQAGAGKVIAIDRDGDAITRGKVLADEYGQDRLVLVHDTFSHMDTAVSSAGEQHVDAVVLDLGVSSFQLDEAEKGFSYQQDGPLDMRMGKSEQTAADVLNTFSEKDIADILYQYGEERKSRIIAKKIIARRKEHKFATTQDLLDVIEKVFPHKGQKRKHPATRTFQALRIFVNRELDEVEASIPAALNILKPGGRLLVVTFHSLEDRIVKHRFRELKKEHRHTLPVKKFVAPGEEEIVSNPRARSAKLRVLEKAA